MNFKMTPHGIRARVPLLVIEETTFIDLSCTVDDCSVFLRVEQRNKSGVYSVISSPRGSRLLRILTRGSRQYLPSGEMTKIYLTNETSGPDLPHTIGFPCNANPHTPFHFSFTLSLASAGSLTGIKPKVAAQNVEESWKGSPPAVIQIFYRNVFFVICGICTAQTRSVGNQSELSSYVHWAHVLRFGQPEALDRFSSGAHDCTRDHIADWPDGKSVFRFEIGPLRDWKVELSFVKSKLYLNTLRLCSVAITV